MSYKQKTPHLAIPVVGRGDRISPDVEMRKYTIIENMLIAGTQGLTEVVFDDGSYSLDKEGEEYSVSVRAGGTYPSMHGIVGGFYFKAAPKVAWDGLAPGRLHYLYVKATPQTPHQNSSVRLTSSTVELGKGSLLMATVDLREESPEVNPYPDGKVYSQDVARHASDTSNPHGRKVEQDEMVIAKALVLMEGAQVEIGSETVSAGDFVTAVAALVGRTAQSVDFDSGGLSGAVVRAGGKVLSVQVHRRVVGSFDDSLGHVGVGYFGEDPSVDGEREFKVYNTGAEGVPMRALVICG
jgi:hypothetical protein